MSQAPKIKTITLVLLMCAALSVILCSYRGAAMPDRSCDTRDAASLVAESFVKSDETFKFDGMKDTLSIRVEHAASLHDLIGPKLSGMAMAVTLPLESREYKFKAKFDSRHSGYGDRDGKYLLEVITPHEAEITVSGCQVTSAVMDGKWDMVGEKMIQ
jgi:hypothetical protein